MTIYLRLILLGRAFSSLARILSLQAMNNSAIQILQQGQGLEYIEKKEPFVQGTSKLKYTFCYHPAQTSLQKDQHRQRDLPPPIPYVRQEGLMAKVTAEEPLLSKQSSSSNLENRYEVQDPSQWPHCVHGHLMMRFGEEDMVVGSGILVGPNHERFSL